MAEPALLLIQHLPEWGAEGRLSSHGYLSRPALLAQSSLVPSQWSGLQQHISFPAKVVSMQGTFCGISATRVWPEMESQAVSSC